jgi:hypothetical protein
MAAEVLPVPASLKQNARSLKDRNAEVVFWWSNGVNNPGQAYSFSIGEGSFSSL